MNSKSTSESATTVGTMPKRIIESDSESTGEKPETLSTIKKKRALDDSESEENGETPSHASENEGSGEEDNDDRESSDEAQQAQQPQAPAKKVMYAKQIRVRLTSDLNAEIGY